MSKQYNTEDPVFDKHNLYFLSKWLICPLLIIAGILDIYTTYVGIESGYFTEGNPFWSDAMVQGASPLVYFKALLWKLSAPASLLLANFVYKIRRISFGIEVNFMIGILIVVVWTLAAILNWSLL